MFASAQKGAGNMVLRGAIRPERRSTFPAATVIPESPSAVNPPKGDEYSQRSHKPYTSR
jgi:hypothetical protein